MIPPPRGIRNCNPGNLQYNSYTAGLGSTGVEPDGTFGRGRFAVFPDMQTGIYALCMNLLNYQSKGINTMRGIVSKWAPSNENNTGAYLTFMDTVLNCQPDDVFNFRNADFLYWTCTGIGEEECGHDEFTEYVTDAQINAGVNAALQ